MDKEIIENIKKSSYFDIKIKKIENLLEEMNYRKAYEATAALIEIVCIILLEKKYTEKIEESNIVTLIPIFNKYHEDKIKEILVDINGEYNSIKLSDVKEIDILSLLGKLDDIVKIILQKHGDIF